ncbi:(2Fe-2S)-binding protein [Clostridium thailandense]|uniref:(2Fe-2S)-binding protein n=1 Tax=Clostridium thailandense TaxID=2794346 RepID=A0A949TP88_9CLOT|nr:(2Fe-2S)-binding protein [Clostridium thailandense]MBV7274067.1 (2Fe-2S)-binding protein [Clostridium thailandense]MCH5137709.1 (2Fe-2S)-binding protein [Clostridiaceae bacterium UIB06]
MEQNVNIEILDKLTKFCVCKCISRATVKKAIGNGAKTIEEVKKVTGAGTGSCCGRRCTPKIQQLLNEYINETPLPLVR